MDVTVWGWLLVAWLAGTVARRWPCCGGVARQATVRVGAAAFIWFLAVAVFAVSVHAGLVPEFSSMPTHR